MSRFIAKTLLFVVLGMLSPALILFGLPRKTGEVVYAVLDKSQKKRKKVVKLLLGDSVGNQLFNSEEYNDSLFSLCSNQAVSMLGHYIYLNNFLEANPDLRDIEVNLLMNPFSLRNNLDQRYTFHYVIKSFYNSTYQPYFSELATSQIKKVPMYYLANIPIIKYSNWAPEYNPQDAAYYDDPQAYFAPISLEYLVKIQELCKTRNLTFRVLAGPIPENKREGVANLDFSKIESRQLSEAFADYQSSMDYLPQDLFYDGTHIKLEEVNLKSLKAVQMVMNLPLDSESKLTAGSM